LAFILLGLFLSPTGKIVEEDQKLNQINFKYIIKNEHFSLFMIMFLLSI
jgi:hypothetical protein